MDRPADTTILVVDDEPTLLALVTRVLERAGYRALTAPYRELALEAYDKSPEPVRGVVIDYHLRPDGGAQLLRELLVQDPDLGVIFTSGSSPDADGRNLLEACGGEFVHKPFAPDGLLRALESVLAARGTRQT